MDVARIKEFLFRHIEKIVLGLVILFVGYRVYVNLFAGEVVQPARPGTQAVPAPSPGTEIDASFWQTASPFLCPPAIEGARYNWFYPPKTHWARYVELVEPAEGKESKDRARVPMRRKAVGSPQVTALTEDERVMQGIPVIVDTTLTAMCEIAVSVVPAQQGEPAGDVLLIEAKKAGHWARIMVMLENQDRFCVAVSVAQPGTEVESGPAVAKIEEIREEPLGTVILRFNAPRGSLKLPGKVINYIEPTYFEIRRKGERDTEEVAIGRVPGRSTEPAEPGAAPGPAPAPGSDEPAGFPGAAKKAAPRAKGGPPPTKGAQAAATGEMVFEDMSAEAEVTYTYRVRSVVLPSAEGAEIEERTGNPVSWKTLPRFTFAYLGGDAQHAKIRVYIGPRDAPQGSRDYDRVPIGGWVGEVPKEFRSAPEPAEEAPPEPAKGAPAKAKAAPAALGEALSARFVTRCILVDIEQSVFRPVPQDTRRTSRDAMGGVKTIIIKTFRETQDRRIILRDAKNRLQYLWREEAEAPPPPVKGK